MEKILKKFDRKTKVKIALSAIAVAAIYIYMLIIKKPQATETPTYPNQSIDIIGLMTLIITICNTVLIAFLLIKRSKASESKEEQRVKRIEELKKELSDLLHENTKPEIKSGTPEKKILERKP